jgi:hypothetical protein
MAFIRDTGIVVTITDYPLIRGACISLRPQFLDQFFDAPVGGGATINMSQLDCRIRRVGVGFDETRNYGPAQQIHRLGERTSQTEHILIFTYRLDSSAGNYKGCGLRYSLVHGYYTAVEVDGFHILLSLKRPDNSTFGRFSGHSTILLFHPYYSNPGSDDQSAFG